MRFAGFCEKRLQVLGDDLVERRGFGFVPLVAFGRDERWPLARRVQSHQATISEPRAKGDVPTYPRFDAAPRWPSGCSGRRSPVGYRVTRTHWAYS